MPSPNIFTNKILSFKTKINIWIEHHELIIIYIIIISKYVYIYNNNIIKRNGKVPKCLTWRSKLCGWTQTPNNILLFALQFSISKKKKLINEKIIIIMSIYKYIYFYFYFYSSYSLFFIYIYLFIYIFFFAFTIHRLLRLSKCAVFSEKANRQSFYNKRGTYMYNYMYMCVCTRWGRMPSIHARYIFSFRTVLSLSLFLGFSSLLLER